MNVYKITFSSACGSYFGSYLQGLTIIADNQDNAIEYAKNSAYGDAFQKSDIKFYTALLVENIENIKNCRIIDDFYDSDY